MRRNLRPYGILAFCAGARRLPSSDARRRETGGLRSPRFIAGMSLVLALIAVAVAIAALVLALNANSDG